MTAIDPTSTFPTSLDTFPTVTAADDQNELGKEHWSFHNLLANAVRAAQQEVLDLADADALKAPLASPTFTGTVTIPTGGSITAPTGLVKGDVGLANVDNTADSAKTFNASALTAGTVATARLGSGTADSTTFLRGDQTYATPAGAGGVWGAITGTLSSQTDLNTALGLKAPLASPTFTGTVTIPTGASITAPTGLVKGDVGLGNVDNTSDATKNAASVTLTNKTLTSPVVNTPTGIVKGDVGLGSVDNTADTAKPVSTAQQTALNLKANLASPTFTGTVTIPTGASITAPTGIVKGDVGLGNVDNTSNATERAATATLTNKTLTSPAVNTPTGIVKGDVGLGNVDNTSNATERAASATLTNKTLTAPVITTPTGLVPADMPLGRQTFSNADVTIAATTRVLAQTGTMSAGRAATLPAANAVPAGASIRVVDESGTVTSSNYIGVTRAGSDTVNGGSAAMFMVLAYGIVEFVSDGSSKWTSNDRGLVLSVAHGGTGAVTATAAFDALSPVTTRGDLIVRDASNNVRLAKGTSGTFLKQGANDPAWTAITASDVANSYSAIGTDTAQTSLTNPTALTTLLASTFTLTNSSVAAGDTFEIEGSGTYTNSQNATTLELQLLLGAVALYDYTSATLNTSANARRFYFRIVFSVKVATASGHINSGGMIMIGSAGTTTMVSMSAVAGGAGGDIAVGGANTTSIDFTNPGAFDLKAKIGTSSSSATVNLRHFRITKLAA